MPRRYAACALSAVHRAESSIALGGVFNLGRTWRRGFFGQLCGPFASFARNGNNFSAKAPQRTRKTQSRKEDLQ